MVQMNSNVYFSIYDRLQKAVCILKHPSVVTFSCWGSESLMNQCWWRRLRWNALFFPEPHGDVTGQSWYTKATFPRSPWGKEVIHKVAIRNFQTHQQNEVTGITTPDFGKHPERTEVWRQRFDTWSEVSAFVKMMPWCKEQRWKIMNI